MHAIRRDMNVAITTALIGLTLCAAAPAQAAGPTSFGARLDNFSQPANAEGGLRCSDEIPNAKTCTWVSVQAFHNGGHEKAPKKGTIKHVKLVTCVAGSFTLQLAQANPATKRAKVVRNGPVIKYKPDPRQVDADPDTVCGGDEGDQYIVQTFATNVAVKKGEYIAIKAAKGGTFYCSGGSGLQLFTPLAPNGPTRTAKATASCNLLVQLTYN